MWKSHGTFQPGPHLCWDAELFHLRVAWKVLVDFILLINKVGHTSLQLPGGWQYFGMKMVGVLLISEFAYRTIEIPFKKSRHRLP